MYAQVLASNNVLSKGGTHGMLAYWQDVSLKVHLGDLNINQGIKELQRTFMNFDENIKNLKKQDFLQDSFIKYHTQFDKKGFKFLDTKRRIKWNITSSGLLTGLTPWVIKNNDKYYSYFFSEQPFDWDSQLKFPLIQEYLAENNVECDINQMNVGIYCLSNDRFSFRSFSQKELRLAVDETIEIFEKVDKEVNRIKRVVEK